MWWPTPVLLGCFVSPRRAFSGPGRWRNRGGSARGCIAVHDHPVGSRGGCRRGVTRAPLKWVRLEMQKIDSGGGRLDGKVPLLAGATSGIGRKTAEMFAAEGASVVIGMTSSPYSPASRRSRRRPEQQPSLRGHGASVAPKPFWACSVADFVEDMASVADDLPVAPVGDRSFAVRLRGAKVFGVTQCTGHRVGRLHPAAGRHRISAPIYHTPGTADCTPSVA